MCILKKKCYRLDGHSIPLQIAFIGADKRIQQIEDLEPNQVTLNQPAQYALEWFDNNNIKVVDLLHPNSRVIKFAFKGIAVKAAYAFWGRRYWVG